MNHTPTPTLDQLASKHFPHLPLHAGREAVHAIMRDLNRDTWRDANFEYHHLLKKPPR